MNQSLVMLVVFVVALTGCSEASGEPLADSVLSDAETVLCAETSGTFSSAAYKVIVVAKTLGLATPADGVEGVVWSGSSIMFENIPYSPPVDYRHPWDEVIEKYPSWLRTADGVRSCKTWVEIRG